MSPCVRKHTRTSATQTSLRHPPSAPILSGLYVYNGRSDESGGYGTIPNAPSLTLAVGFRNENPPSNLHQHQCLQSLHTLITMRSCRGNFLHRVFSLMLWSISIHDIHHRKGTRGEKAKQAGYCTASAVGFSLCYGAMVLMAYSV